MQRMLRTFASWTDELFRRLILDVDVDGQVEICCNRVWKGHTLL